MMRDVSIWKTPRSAARTGNQATPDRALIRTAALILAAPTDCPRCAPFSERTRARCLLLALNGPRSRDEQCLLMGVKQTQGGHRATSESDPKRTSAPLPKADLPCCKLHNRSWGSACLKARQTSLHQRLASVRMSRLANSRTIRFGRLLAGHHTRRISPQASDHSLLMFADRMIGHHFSISALCNVPSASGVCCSRGKSSMPRSANR
jgi:hypothetical protein